MGNKQSRQYPTNNVKKSYTRYEYQVMLRLQLLNARKIDFHIFYEVLMREVYHYMPEDIAEAIFLAFAQDKTCSIPINEFQAIMSIPSNTDRSSLTSLLQFIFRIYDPGNTGYIEKSYVKQLLEKVYAGRAQRELERILRHIDSVFQVPDHNRTSDETAASAAYSVNSKYNKGNNSLNNPNRTVIPVETLSLAQFEQYRGSLQWIGGWMIHVLRICTDPYPQNYTIKQLSNVQAEMDTATLANNYDFLGLSPDVKENLIKRLELKFKFICLNKTYKTKVLSASDSIADSSDNSAGKATNRNGGGSRGGSDHHGLSLQFWLLATSDFLAPNLAMQVFFLLCRHFNPVWTLAELVQFCDIFGCHEYNQEPLISHLSKRMIEFYNRKLVRNCVGDIRRNTHLENEARSIDARSKLSVSTLKRAMKHLVIILSQSIVATPMPSPLFTKFESRNLAATAEGVEISNSKSLDSPLDDVIEQLGSSLPPVLKSDLALLLAEDREDVSLKDFIALMMEHEADLPGLRDLSMTACCLFGVRPRMPKLEQIFVTELKKRWELRVPMSLTQGGSDVGPVGTEWAVLGRQWWDSWAMYTSSGDRDKRQGQGFTTRFSIAEMETLHESTSFLSSSDANNSPSPRGGMQAGSSSPTSSASTLSPRDKEMPLTPRRILAPGKIDNYDYIVKDETGAPKLLGNVKLHEQINIVSPVIFASLHNWYGGGPTVLRKVIFSNIGNSLQLELFPLQLHMAVCDGRDAEVATRGLMPSSMTGESQAFSRATLVSDLLTSFAQARNVNVNNVRLWNWPKLSVALGAERLEKGSKDGRYSKEHVTDSSPFSNSYFTYQLKNDQTLEESNVATKHCLVYEILGDTEGSTWPSAVGHYPSHMGRSSGDSDDKNFAQFAAENTGKRGVSNNDSMSSDSNSSYNSINNSTNNIASVAAASKQLASKSVHKVNRSRMGRVGLDNLGNTCYCNSSIQALLSIPHLRDYFLFRHYLADINTKNRMGHKGKVAKSFAQLAADMCSSDKKCILPRQFVSMVSQLNPQFAGHQQQDAQEFVAFILDGLSEDLNFVGDKPYLQMPDSDGRPDDEVAEIWWGNHLKRDSSVVQALFMGQFRSETYCTECKHSSVRFEPFNLLCLPFPDGGLKYMSVSVVPLHYSSTDASCGIGSGIGSGSAVNMTPIYVTVPVEKGDDLSNMCDAVLRLEGMAEICGLAKSEEFDGEYNYDDFHCIICEVSDNRIKVIYSATYPLEKIKNTKNIYIFQVRNPVTMAKSMYVPNKADLSHVYGVRATKTPLEETERVDTPPKKSGEDINEESNQRGRDNTSTSPSNETAESDASSTTPSREKWTAKPLSLPALGSRVCFVQRGIELAPDSSLPPSMAANSTSVPFKLQIFGTPFADSVPAGISGRELYDLVHERVIGLTGVNPETISNLTLFAKDFNLCCEEDASMHRFPSPSPSQAVDQNIVDDRGLISIDVNSIVNNRRSIASPSSSSSSLSSFSALSSINADFDSLVGGLRPIATDIELCASVPRLGFLLRIVSATPQSEHTNNGQGQAVLGCMRCSWLKRCDGCMVLDDPSVSYSLRDGEMVAIDWHALVSQEVLGNFRPPAVVFHQSSKDEAQRAASYSSTSSSSSSSMASSSNDSIPLSQCFEKFTEEEILEGIPCSKCKELDSTRKKINIWRSPPVLAIQLKRFKFDDVSRRKLNSRVIFPLSDLDLSPYTAKRVSLVRKAEEDVANSSCDKNDSNDTSKNSSSSSSSSSSSGEEPDKQAEIHVETNGDLTGASSTSSSSSAKPRQPSSQHLSISVDTRRFEPISDALPEYDLYSVVYHVGALSGGHYVAAFNSSRANGTLDGNFNSNSGGWLLYNDSLVTDLRNTQEVTSEYAYLLFYVRKDMAALSVEDVMRPYREHFKAFCTNDNDNAEAEEGGVEEEEDDDEEEMVGGGGGDAPSTFGLPTASTFTGIYSKVSYYLSGQDSTLDSGGSNNSNNNHANNSSSDSNSHSNNSSINSSISDPKSRSQADQRGGDGCSLS